MIDDEKIRMIHTDQIAVLEVKAVELVAGLLGIHYVFIDNEGRALGVVGNALTDLSAMGVSMSAVRRGCRAWPSGRETVVAYRIGPNFPNRSNNSSGVTL